MSNTREYDHLVFLQKLISGDYLFVYDAGDNNAVILILTTPDSEDTPEVYIPDEGVVETMVDENLKYMECQNGNICNDYDSSFEDDHKTDNDTYSMYYDIYCIYIWISEPTNEAKYLVKVNSIVYLSDND